MRICYTTLETFDPTETQTSLLLSLLPVYARSRILRYRRTEDRNRSLIGWLLLFRWKEGAGYGGQALDGLVQVSETGKPEFRLTGLDDSKDKVDYNISHDDELIVFAVESTSPTISDRRAMVQPVVGVDCMRLDRAADELPALEEVLMAQLTESEQADVPSGRMHSHPSQSAAFVKRMHHLLTLWTIKEAYTKMLGLGLSLDLKRLEVTFVRPLETLLESQMVSRTISTKTGPKELEQQCHLCDGSIRVSQDGQDLATPTGSDSQYHLRIRRLEIALERMDEADNQVYVWACVWRSAGEDCRSWSMERVDGQELLSIRTGSSEIE